MSQKTIHILHLTERWLRWATLGEDRHGFTLESSGELPCAAPDKAPDNSIVCLDEWLDKMERPGEILLYDGRPMFFSFSTRLPRKAAAQIDGAVRLAIRKELGLAEDAIRWTTWPDGESRTKDLVSFTTIVTRRESLQDIEDWQRKHRIASLWVGADVCAVTALVQTGLAPPVLVLNACGAGATLYYADNGGPHGGLMSKAWTGLAADREPHDPAWLAELAGGGRARADFGRGYVAPVLESCPALAALTAAPEADWSGPGKSKRLASLPPELLRFDAVILGGIVQQDAADERMDSLLREETAKPFLAGFGRIPNARRQALTLVAAALVLVLSLWLIHGQRGAAREKLAARASRLKPASQLLEAREGVLRGIRADRAAAMTPVLEALHQAAPAGLSLQSFSFGASGLVKIQGQAQGTDMANAFFKGISESRQFEPGSVQLQEVKLEGQKASFQLTARIKGRTKR